MKPFGFSSSTVVSVVALATLLTACAPAATEKEPTPPRANDAVATTPAPAALPLRQTVWAWQHTQQSGAWFAPAVPARYTLTFQEENRLAIVADCNRGGTVYHIQEDRLTFELIAMTKILCPTDSLDRDFLNGLQAVDTYRIDGETLTLQLRQGGEMLFAPAQP